LICPSAPNSMAPYRDPNSRPAILLKSNQSESNPAYGPAVTAEWGPCKPAEDCCPIGEIGDWPIEFGLTVPSGAGGCILENCEGICDVESCGCLKPIELG